MNNFNDIKKYFYPVVSAVFVIIVLSIFYLLVQFLFSQTNLIFQADEELTAGQVIGYDLEKFGRIEKKFEQVVKQMEAEDVRRKLEEKNALKIQKEQSEEIEPRIKEKILDKKSVTIQVLNGKGVSGLASALKKKLEAREFVVKNIGNAPRTRKTTLKIKNSKKDFIGLLKKAAEESGHKILETNALSEKSAYDAVIVIGKE